MKVIKLFLLLQIVGLIYTDFVQVQDNWKLVWQDDMQHSPLFSIDFLFIFY